MRWSALPVLLMLVACSDPGEPCGTSADCNIAGGGAGGAGGENDGVGGMGGTGGVGGIDYHDDCHVDCFGWNDCVDGVVTHYTSQPVPCDDWAGECPHIDNAYVCEKGCRTDGNFGFLPENACEEWRPKSEGDPCESPRDCLPVVAGTYLRCSAGGVCETSSAPTLEDLWGHCGITQEDLRPSPDAYAYGTVRTDSCQGGWCLFLERDECIFQGCTTACEWNQDCPEGTFCDSYWDWSADLEEGVQVGVCDAIGPAGLSGLEQACR